MSVPAIVEKGGKRSPVGAEGDPVKVALAQRLRCEMTMTLVWIAARLQMGTKTHARSQRKFKV